MAKWIRNRWNKSLTYEELEKAHKLSKKGKGYRKEVIEFELKKEDYLMYLLDILKRGKYKHGEYKIFYVYEPKLRKIEKARYIDRIVHRWYVDSFIAPYCIPTFINTTYACIKERGMHKACLDVQQAMRKMKRKYNTYYILKMDVKKYFENIDKEILFNILSKKIKDKKVIWLTKEIIYSKQGTKGLPIGNYTSQLFANIYLNEIDKYVKETLRIKYYFRYLDDSVLLVQTKQEAKQILEKIRKFLKEKLQLELNQKTQIFKNKQGVNFCGYQIKEHKLKIRQRGKRKLVKKIRYLKKEIKQGRINSKEAKKYLAGHIGYIKIADIEGIKRKYFDTE